MKTLKAIIILLALISTPSMGFGSSDQAWGFFGWFGNDAKSENKAGNEARNRGDYEEARKHFKKATELDPSYARAHYNLGHMLFILGKNPDALKSLNRAVSLHQNGAGFTTRGVVRLALGDVKGSISDQAEARRLAPPDWGVVPNNMGCAKMFAGDALGAAESFAQAKIVTKPELKPHLPRIVSELKQQVDAAIASHQGKFTEADLTHREQQGVHCGVKLD